MRSAWLSVLAGLAATCLLLAQGGCVWNGPVRVELDEGVSRPARCVVVFFADGVHVGTLLRLAEDGRLPHIKQHLLDRGARFAPAVTVMPSITFAASVSAATGQFPGHHQVTGNRWFDRDTLMLEDYEGILDYQHVDAEFIPPTIFEMVPDLYSVTVLSPVHRGSTRHFANWLSTGVTWFFGTMHQVDALTAYRINEIGREAAAARRWPDLLWFYFPGPDHVAHESGRDSPEYVDVLRNLDVQVGRIVAGIQQAGVYDRTLLVLASDHGHVAVDPKRHVDLVAVLKKRFGFAVGYRELIRGTYLERLRVFGPPRIVAADDGNRRAVLHLRVADGWHQRPTLAQIERFGRDHGGRTIRDDPRPFWDVLLEAMPPRHLAAVRDGPDRVLITDSAGRAVVHRQTHPSATDRIPAWRTRAESFRYEILAGPDPLRLADFPPAARLIDGRFHGSQDWLAATADSPAPDVVAQIVDYFDSPRSGDLLLFSIDGWQFSQPSRGGHGSITPDEMHIPFVFAGPGVAAGTRAQPARLVDLVPTVLDYLGRLETRANAAPLDGVSRLGVLVSPAAPAATQPAGGPAAGNFSAARVTSSY